MAIGEAGKLSTTINGKSHEFRVEFTEPITNPVIYVGPTGSDGRNFKLSITARDQNGFRISVINPGNPSLRPKGVNLRWIAFTEGDHTLSDGRRVAAGQADKGLNIIEAAVHTDTSQGPIVLTSTKTSNRAGTQDPGEIGAHGTEIADVIALSVTDEIETTEADSTEPHLDHVSAFVESFADGIILGDIQPACVDGGAEAASKSPSDHAIHLTLREKKRAGTRMSLKSGKTDFGVAAGEFVSCFTRDSRITTPHGQRAVRDLLPGDLVVTADHGLQQVLWINRERLTREFLEKNPEHCPIRIRRGALGAGLPQRELVVPPQQRLVLSAPSFLRQFGSSRVLAPAKALVDSAGIEVLPPNRGWTYYHLLLPTHSLIMAEGCVTESLSAQAAERLKVPSRFDDLPIWKATAPLPILSDQKAQSLWARLKPTPESRMGAPLRERVPLPNDELIGVRHSA